MNEPARRGPSGKPIVQFEASQALLHSSSVFPSTSVLFTVLLLVKYFSGSSSVPNAV